MGTLAKDFSPLDTDKHARVRGAIKHALDADFKVEEEPKHKADLGFSKKPLAFFVRETIDPASLVSPASSPVPEPKGDEKEEAEQEGAGQGTADQAGSEQADDPSHPAQEPAEISGEPAAPAGAKNAVSDDDDALEQFLTQDETSDTGAPDAATQTDSGSALDQPAENADNSSSESYEEGFAAGRAAAMSELEQQRLEHLEVLKSISDKLLSDDCFDFENISSRIVNMVNEMASERCGIAIEEAPEHFIKRIQQLLEQIRIQSNDRIISLNDMDLEALKSFEEFSQYFKDAQIKPDASLMRGEVIVQVGGVEIRDTPFSQVEGAVKDE